MSADGLQFNTDWRLVKFEDKNDKLAKKIRAGEITVDEVVDSSFEESFIHGNAATTAGIKFLTYYLCGLGGAPSSTNLFDNGHAYLVTGKGSGAAAQTDSYATFDTPSAMASDGSFPTLSGASPWVLTWESTWGGSDANQAWNEFGVGNTSAAAVLFNRVVASKGTKSSGETWVLQLAITFT